MHDFLQQLVDNLRQTSLLEFIGVVSGIASVFYSRKENILVYPVGMISTIIYIYLSFKGSLYGEASVNIYYTIMSIYGWILWSKRNAKQEIVLQISYSNKKEWMYQLLFFLGFYVGIYLALTYLKNEFYSNTIPLADAFASATAYTGMWLMAKKKIESWIWWMATNAASIPLYYIKGYAFTSVQYIVLFILAVAGLLEWIKKAKEHKAEKLAYARD